MLTPSPSLSAGQVRVLEMIATGAPLPRILDALVRVIEAEARDLIASILLLDDDGMYLRHGAAPGLPADFREAIDGGAIGPRAGSCGTAAYRREPVVVFDIETDPLWDAYRELARRHGLRACWSTPILDPDGKLLGTFAMYWREPCRPQPEHDRLIAVATHLASIALARWHDERARGRLVHSLDERIKELTLLHAAARLLQAPRELDSELLQQFVALLPGGWQYPELCQARIRVGELEVRTPGWRDSPWMQSASRASAAAPAVVIDVAYTALPAGAPATPFLDEEAALLQSLADMLGARLERDRMHTALREQERTFRSVFENAGVGMTLVDAQQRIVRCNPAFARMLGYDEQELRGMHIAQFSHADDMPTNAQLYESLVAGEIDRFQMLKRYLRKDGSQMWGELTVSRARAGREAGYLTVGMVEDVTERKQAESRLEHLATHDALTDLPNRYLINDRINQALPHARRAATLVGVMCVGLDRFKIINDAFGHRYGDELLKCVAGRLCAAIRDGDTVARHSGDEFLILLADLRRSTDAYIVAQKVLEAVAAPIRLQDRETYITASVGVSVAPQDGGDADTLVANADAAMHRAKDLGRNTYQFFTRAMSEETRDRVALETRLRHAIAREELQLMYQPKVDLASGAIIGCEALLRWNQSEAGAISPAQFIPIAEQSGLIVPIGDWVLRTACAQNLAWQRAGLAPITVSVNISARQFLQQDVARWVLGVLEQTALAGCWLELELTESLIAQDVEAVIHTIHALKEVGITMSIDDFGTGYSSLSYLKRFRVDTLKVDKSFVRDLLSDPDDAAIARAVISLGHSLGMRVIAEGVESAAQCAFLRTHGCDQIQGYYFSAPVPAERIAEMLASGQRLDMQAWGETAASVQSA